MSFKPSTSQATSRPVVSPAATDAAPSFAPGGEGAPPPPATDAAPSCAPGGGAPPPPATDAAPSCAPAAGGGGDGMPSFKSFAAALTSGGSGDDSSSNQRQESGAALTPDGGSGGSGSGGHGAVHAATAALVQPAAVTAETKAAPGVGRPGKAPQRREHPDLKAALAKWGLSREQKEIALLGRVEGHTDIPLVCALMTLKTLTTLNLSKCLKSSHSACGDPR